MNIDILLRAKYDKTFPKLDKFVIIIKNRGSPENIKKIKGSEIEEITKGHFTLKDGTYIPAHRIIKIIRPKRGLKQLNNSEEYLLSKE